MANETDSLDETRSFQDLNFVELSDLPETEEFKKPGKKKNDIWNYFIEEEARKFGHSPIEASVKEQYLRILAQNNEQSSGRITTRKRKLNEEIATGIQPKITSKLQKSAIDPGQQYLCNRALTRFFVCCGVLFSTVESPFFIDLVMNLCVSYQLPDRKTLSDTWLSNEVARITVDVEEILKKQENLSLAEEIKKVLKDIGPQRFSSVVSDGASAMQLAKRLISEEYPKILPVHYITHHMQLICTDIMKKNPFSNNILINCQKFVTYFAESHQSGATLREKIKKELIVGGRLKSSVKTRWSTAWDCCTSVLRLETIFKNMLIADSKAMNQTLQNLVNNRNFWLNVESLTTILEPAKNAVKSIEGKNATMADVFLALIQMATAIKALSTESTEELKEFRQKCIQFYNNRWKQFDHELYLLAYFLHPKFRGKGFIPKTYQLLIQRKAFALWSKMGGGLKSAFTLAVQMNNYDDF
ncbi:6013_t:CDS:2, partial [Rhizophagus irregularis]